MVVSRQKWHFSLIFGQGPDSVIGVLIFPDFQLLDAAGPISAFEIAARFAEGAPAIRTLAVTPGPVRSSSGIEIVARGLKSASAVTTLIVAGGEGVRQAAACRKTLNFVRAIARRGVRIASVCSGAYVLAEAGLLDGRRATTHWQRTRHFVKTYPQVRLEPDRIFVRDGDVWTSAGISGCKGQSVRRSDLSLQRSTPSLSLSASSLNLPSR